jgi:hypothetical protein
MVGADYKYDEEARGDSQDDWFIVLISDSERSIYSIPISYSKVSLTNQTPICGTNLKLTFDLTGQVTVSR